MANEDVLSCQGTAGSPSVRLQHVRQGWKFVPRFWRSLLGGAACLVLALAEHASGGIIFPSGDSTSRTQAELTVRRLGADVENQAGLAELSQAIDRFQQGQLQASLERLQAAFAANDRLPPPPVMLARMLIVTSQPAASREFLERAAIDYADSAHVHLAFGQLAIHEGRISDAQLHLEKAGQLQSAEAESRRASSVGMEILNGFVWVALQREQWSAAEQFLNRILQVNPDDHPSRHRLGIALFSQEKFDRAEQELRAAAAADDSLEPAPLTLAWLFQQRQADGEAVRWMEVALEEAGEDPRVLRAATLLYFARDDLESARSHAARWLQLQHESGEAILLSAKLARASGDLNQARQLLERRLMDEPDDFESAYQLVLVLADSDDSAERARGLRRADPLRRQFSQHPLSHTAFAWAFYRASGELSEEQKTGILGLFDQAIGAGAATPEVIFQYAQLQHAVGDAARGDALLEELLSLKEPFATRAAAEALQRRRRAAEGAVEHAQPAATETTGGRTGNIAEGSDAVVP